MASLHHANRRVSVLVSHVGTKTPSSIHMQVVHALSENPVVAVTGAVGFVGSWITRTCLDRGYSVRACARNVGDEKKVGFLKAMPEYGGRLTLHEADMTVPGAYDAIFAGCSVVFHPAEVYMSFAPGRDARKAAANFEKHSGKMTGVAALHGAALTGAQYIVDSINKSGTVKRLIYTSSIASLVGGPQGGSREDQPLVDETHVSAPDGVHGYGNTKRLLEKFFDFQAEASGGKWTTLIGNPGDVIGPILSSHQSHENWQGRIATVVEGNPPTQDAIPNGRPFLLVDVRDVAMAQVLLAESTNVPSGSRFILSSGDKLPLRDIGVRAMELHPNWHCPTFEAPPQGQDKLNPFWTFYYRMQLNNSKIRDATGMHFRSFDDTFKATLDALVDIGGVRPCLKSS